MTSKSAKMSTVVLVSLGDFQNKVIEIRKKLLNNNDKGNIYHEGVEDFEGLLWTELEELKK